MYDVTFRLKGLACTACQRLAKKRLEKMGGVNEANVALDGTTVLHVALAPTPEAVNKALAGTGFELASAIR